MSHESHRLVVVVDRPLHRRFHCVGLRAGRDVMSNSESAQRTTEPKLSGAATDTLLCMFLHGPTWDGDVPSKSGRDELVSLGLASRGAGYQWLTDAGARLCLRLGYASRKERHDRKRRSELSTLEARNAELRKMLEAKISIISGSIQRTGKYDG